MAVQAVAVGGFRRETVETYRRIPGHVLRNLSGAAPTFTGLPIGSEVHSRIPDMPPVEPAAHMGLSCCMCGSVSAWEPWWVAAEGE